MEPGSKRFGSGQGFLDTDEECRLILCDLQTARPGYIHRMQRSLFPAGIPTQDPGDFSTASTQGLVSRKVPAGSASARFRRHADRHLRFRGFGSLRGFTSSMKVAKRICDLRKDVLFVVVGSDQSLRDRWSVQGEVVFARM